MNDFKDKKDESIESQISDSDQGELEREVQTDNINFIESAVESIMQRFLGVSVYELNKDISSKLRDNPLLIFHIDDSKSFKEAKKQFKAEYIKRLLDRNYGNISEVAKMIDVDRRSVHRFVEEKHIPVKEIRKDMLKPEYVKMNAINNILEGVMKDYHEIIHPDKLKNVYQNLDHISKNILISLPEKILSLKEASYEFEKQFLKIMTGREKNMKKLSKKIGLRYETLIRKMKKYGIKV